MDDNQVQKNILNTLLFEELQLSHSEIQLHMLQNG